ncbi:hypothetical protein WMF26_31205 [Sorangium sp. So ce185]|uniref:hypothetical protein n=1 Tax=Sorangium sp. So ce185 TaxID=3133287 RepID=UPI003F6083F2
MRTFCRMTLLASLLTVTASAQSADPSTTAAEASVAEARSARNARIARALGLSSPNDLGSITLDAPLRVYHVDLTSLQRYSTGVDASSLLRDVGQRLLAVRLAGAPTSTIGVLKTSAGWSTFRMGDRARAAGIDRAASALAGNASERSGGTFFVQVPALGVEFLASVQGGELRLSPVKDAPAYGVALGSVGRAEEVLASLVPAAQAISSSSP